MVEWIKAGTSNKANGRETTQALAITLPRKTIVARLLSGPGANSKTSGNTNIRYCLLAKNSPSAKGKNRRARNQHHPETANNRNDSGSTHAWSKMKNAHGANKNRITIVSDHWLGLVPAMKNAAAISAAAWPIRKSPKRHSPSAVRNRITGG